MYKMNNFCQNLPTNYLFAEIAERVAFYEKKYPKRKIISLGIGDVSRPLVPAVIEALHKAVNELEEIKTFRGYGPAGGYSFLKQAMANEIPVEADEIFISDGAKSDLGNIQEMFAKDCMVAVCNPTYPVYEETNLMAGRTIQCLECEKENGFIPRIPEEAPDIIYLCSPNNPTGIAMKKKELQKWVDYANKYGCLIVFDAAYEAYIEEIDVPHSIYECEGARQCAIEIRSFSKNAGFTGLRLGAMIVPKELPLHSLWIRRQSVRYNGAPYIVQRAAEAIYTEEGKKQISEQIAYYKRNARVILETLKKSGFEVYGGINAPYIWMKTPDGFDSWKYFEFLIEKAGVVVTPGVGFGSEGEGYVRLSALNSYENTLEAMKRVKSL